MGQAWRAAPGLHAAFPADVDGRIVGGIGAADDDAALLEADEGAVALLHAADEVAAGGHQDLAPAVDGAGVERLLEGAGILGGAIADGAEIADVMGGGENRRESQGQAGGKQGG